MNITFSIELFIYPKMVARQSIPKQVSKDWDLSSKWMEGYSCVHINTSTPPPKKGNLIVAGHSIAANVNQKQQAKINVTPISWTSFDVNDLKKTTYIFLTSHEKQPSKKSKKTAIHAKCFNIHLFRRQKAKSSRKRVEQSRNLQRACEIIPPSN